LTKAFGVKSGSSDVARFIMRTNTRLTELKQARPAIVCVSESAAHWWQQSTSLMVIADLTQTRQQTPTRS
jgi:hypothetical protein